MATKNPANSNVPPDASDLGSQLKNALASADTTTVGRVQQFQQVQQARAGRLTRTAAALKVLYGAKDPGVQDADAAVAAAQATSLRVAMVHQQITTPDPKVAANGWALHGRVFDPELAPVSGCTVFLVDTAKAFQQSYGFAYTDDTGSFLLNYRGADTPSEKASSSATSTTEMFVEVSDRKQRTVYISPSAFNPVPGSATYQNIVLAADDQPIGVPPAALRRVAMPKRKRKS